MIYKQVEFSGIAADVADILIAQLSDMQYEGFEEEGASLKAYIPEAFFDKDRLDELCRRFSVSCSVDLLPDTNWNELWESNFQPVIVDDFCAIRADFHALVPGVLHEIIITPKMSFGTGHHPTTYMMIRQMKAIGFTNKIVLDFGTGTGVLAILAGKLGAKSVLAIDNDDWSIANAEENLEKNNAAAIVKIKKADTAAAGHFFDVILANITRNIILENFPLFAAHIAAKGVLLLSGLMEEDEAVILREAAANEFIFETKLQQGGWICLKFVSR